MRSVKIIFMSVVIAVFISGCVQMRDYTGVRDGAAGLDLKQRFGEGGEKKDYYVVKGGEGIVLGDTKNEVIAHLGLPDKVDTTLEGYECWNYAARKLKLFFAQDGLREWQEF